MIGEPRGNLNNQYPKLPDIKGRGMWVAANHAQLLHKRPSAILPLFKLNFAPPW